MVLRNKASSHSGAEPTGLARSGRPDDTLRKAPGIHNHEHRGNGTVVPIVWETVVMDSGLAACGRAPE
jgi:hypothetical protein